MKNIRIFKSVLAVIFGTSLLLFSHSSYAINDITQDRFYAGIGLFYDTYRFHDTDPNVPDGDGAREDPVRDGSHYIDAARLEGIDDYIVSDETAVVHKKNWPVKGHSISASDTAILMSAGGARIPLTFQNLAPGVYFIRLVGRVDAVIPRIRKPLYIHLRINDGPNGEINDYRMRVNYDTDLEEVGRLFFYGLNTVNNLDAEIYVGSGSHEELLLHRIEFYDALAGTDRQAYKQQPGTFTFEEREYERERVQEIASHGRYEDDGTGKIYGNYTEWRWINSNWPYVPHDLTPEERRIRDDLLWNAMPPLNVMHTGSGGTAPYNLYPGGLSRSEAQALYGRWTLDYGGKPYYLWPYDVPWRIVNNKLTYPAGHPREGQPLDYTLSDYLAHRPLPDPYPYKDDGFGAYYNFAPGNEQYDSPGSYNFIIAPLILTRMSHQYSGAIFVGHGGQGLARRYHLTGDRDAARDASLALVRFTLQWPAMHLEAQGVTVNSANRELNWGYTMWEGRRVGKIYYNGWSGPDAAGLAEAYDMLFDFIQDNQEFADAVHRYIPWVNTPQDIIKLLDTHILQSSIADSKTGRIRQLNPMEIGLIQNPSSFSEELMNITTAKVDIHPQGYKSIKYHYHNSYSQDGTDFIGSSYYVQGSGEIMKAAESIFKYKRLGGTVPFDLTDISKYPKVRAFSEFLLGLSTAGGYYPSVGDVGGAIYDRKRLPTGLGPQVRRIWQFTKDPRAAWYIVNKYGGRTFETNGEWQEILDAAGAQENPIYNPPSRVFGGFGVGILEGGTGEADSLRNALVLRTGTGQGHSHADALDLNIFSMGLRMATDFAQRNEGTLFTQPPDSASYTHNTVSVDGWRHPWRDYPPVPAGNFNSASAWIETFKPNNGAQFMSGRGESGNHKNVELFKRDVAMIDIDEEKENWAPFYTFDVFRVKGGKWHTWCFHGADCGVELDIDPTDGIIDDPDAFRVIDGITGTNLPMANVSNFRSDGLSASYLRKHANDRKYESTASNKVEAIWRLSRTSSTTQETNSDYVNGGTPPLNVTTYAAEQKMLGNDYDEASPRKYTKITLFNHADDTVLTGNLVSQSYHMNIPNLYVQDRQTVQDYALMDEKENVYPALLETYAGESLIASSGILNVSPNENDANGRTIDAEGVVAMEVVTTGGQRDILISDGKNIRRDIDNGLINFQGNFGYYSEDPDGFRMLHLVEGAELTRGDLSVKPDNSLYQATIQTVDYQNMKICTNEQLPEYALDGQEFHIYNGEHHSSYYIVSVRNHNTGSVLTFDKPADMGDFHVETLSGNEITTPDKLILDYVANRNTALTAVNELGTKIWKINKVRDGRHTLTGPSVSLSDFTDEDGDERTSVMVYDFGEGDTVELPSHVWLKKADAANTYMLKSDTSLSLTLPGTGIIEARTQSGDWQDITVSSAQGSVTANIGYDLLSTGELELRLGFDSVTEYPIESINWVNLLGVRETASGGLEKTDITPGWTAGASSRQEIVHGFGGYVEFTAPSDAPDLAIGLSYQDTNVTHEDIDYALRFDNNSDGPYCRVFVQLHTDRYGSATTPIPYNPGDLFRITLENGLIIFYQNGEKIYTMDHNPIAPRYPLVVDTSFYTPGARLDNVKISYPDWPDTNEYQIAPGGTQYGYGTDEKPLDLKIALSGELPIKPGDTLSLRGGVYAGRFTSYLTGTEQAPIVVRGYPGERAILDANVIVEPVLLHDIEPAALTDPWTRETIRVSNADYIKGSQVWIEDEKIYVYTVEPDNQTLHIARNMNDIAPTPHAAGADIRLKLPTQTLHVLGAYTWYRDFEVTNSNPTRVAEGLNDYDLARPWEVDSHNGFKIQAPNTKFINLTIHNNIVDGMGFWSPAVDSEIYGNIIFNNGFEVQYVEDGETLYQSYGHGIYSQNYGVDSNGDGTFDVFGKKVIEDNIISYTFSQAIQCRASEQEYIFYPYEIRGNTVFHSTWRLWKATWLDLLFEENYSYEASGYIGQSYFNEKLSFINNYFGRGFPQFRGWDEFIARGNVLAGSNMYVYLPDNVTLPDPRYDFKSNTYITTNAVINRPMFFPVHPGEERTRTSFEDWKTVYSLDNGTGGEESFYYENPIPDVLDTKVFIRPNKYEEGRGNITIFNWDMNPEVEVDLSSLNYNIGDGYELRYAANWFDDVEIGNVISGVNGNPAINVRMTGRTTAQPLNYPADLPVKNPELTTEFGVFVIIKTDSGSGTPDDTTPPTISNVRVSNITMDSATINWTTNERATSQVAYGETSNYGSMTSLDDSLIIYHYQTITGLDPYTVYHFRVQSEDGDENSSVSSDFNFRSAPIATYTIEATAGGGGTIDPSGSVRAAHSEDYTFTITPNNGYLIEAVVVDGISLGAITTHAFDDVTRDHTISVTFYREPTTPEITLTYNVNDPNEFPEEVTFTADVTTYGGREIIVYEWDFDGKGVIDYRSYDDNEADFTFTGEGTYPVHVRVMDNQGNVGEATINYTAQDENNSVPTLNPISASVAEGEAPLRVFLTGSASSGDISLYEWDFDGDGVYDFESTVSPDVVTTYTQVGAHLATLRVTDDEGLTATGDILITVSESELSMTLGISASPGEGIIPFSCIFTANAGDTVVKRYKWDFDGDGVYDRVSLGPTIQYRYEKAGVFTVTCKATSEDHMSARATTRVKALYMPNDPNTPAALPKFSRIVKDGSIPLMVDFNQELGAIPGVEWYYIDFDGDLRFDLRTQSLDNITYTYREAGVYRARVLMIGSPDSLRGGMSLVTILVKARRLHEGRVFIRIPKDNWTISGSRVMLLSTLNRIAKHYMTSMEFQYSSDGITWTSIGNPITERPFISRWNTTDLNGDYQLKCVVTHTHGQTPNPLESPAINVHIDNTTNDTALLDVKETINENGLIEKSQKLVGNESNTLTMDDGTEVTLPSSDIIDTDEVLTVRMVAPPQIPKVAEDLLRRIIKLIGVYREITISGAHSSFDKDVTIQIPYNESDLAALDIKEEDLKILYYNTETGEWEELFEAWVLPAEDKVIAKTHHFSLFGLGFAESLGLTGDGGGGDDEGCFIATAAYGTPMANEVQVLSQFRDEHLLKNHYGRKFVESYYRLSPSVADYIRKRPMLRAIVRSALRPLIWVVRKFGLYFASSLRGVSPLCEAKWRTPK